MTQSRAEAVRDLEAQLQDLDATSVRQWAEHSHRSAELEKARAAQAEKNRMDMLDS